MNLVISIRDEALRAKMAGWPERLQRGIENVMRRIAIDLQAKVKEEKLSGQVLHVRTGTLRRSINQSVVSEGGSTSAVVGTNVAYAGAHEYGFDGMVSVREHVRRSKAQMADAMRTRTYINRNGEAVTKTWHTRKGMRAGSISVREHERHMVLPERSFLRSALFEMEPDIRDRIQSAAAEALK